MEKYIDMVSCNLIGQQGNQMFTICATLSYALRNGLEYHIPAHTLNDSVWKPMFTHLENPKWNPELPTYILKENQHNYQELPTEIKSSTFLGDVLIDKQKVNIIIDGYRQSLLYFEDYLPEVRKAFGFTYTPIYSLTAALHIRLGDYRFYPTKHPVVSNVYLMFAITEMLERGISHFVVFSDEIYEAKKIIEDLNISSLCQFRYSEGKSEKEDFQEMLYCSHFIISNSTYSLMAAILSESPNKIVISPDESNWFGSGNAHLDVSDLIPKEYIRIKY